MSKIYLKQTEASSQKELSSLAWKYLEKIILQEYHLNIKDLKLSYNPYGKPFFIDACFHFNLSHCQNVIAIALSKDEVGIDVERIKDVHFPSSFAKKINAKSTDSYDMIARFSALEAHFKKEGTGIIYSQLQKEIHISYQTSFSIMDNQYILSLDSQDPIEEIIWL